MLVDSSQHMINTTDLFYVEIIGVDGNDIFTKVSKEFVSYNSCWGARYYIRQWYDEI